MLDFLESLNAFLDRGDMRDGHFRGGFDWLKYLERA